MNESLVVWRETNIAAPRATVFAFLTDPEKILRWMGTEATTEAHPGGLYFVKGIHGRHARGAFREVVPVHRLAYSFGWAEQEARFAPVNDEPDVAVNAHRPEILIFCLVELVEAHAGINRIELQVERGLDGFLLITCQSGEAVGEGIGKTEFHRIRPCRPSSPRHRGD
jgi:uncharacterized protein YndB with AHSA1/START domain